MKYIILVPDGMADEPLMQLGGKTPLEAAFTPHMDSMAQQGLSGLLKTIPEGLPPGSDVGNLALMGYDPLVCYSGRAPLEAANLGIMLQEGDLAFRCNLITVIDGVMVDYSAGHIASEEAAVLIGDLGNFLGRQHWQFYPGKSYRHLLVVKGQKHLNDVTTTAPHDILNQTIAPFLPSGEGQEFLLGLMEKAQQFLSQHPLNQARVGRGDLPANMIWLWGQGGNPRLPSFKSLYGLTGSVISAVDLVNGIGRLAGLTVIDVPGANGYYDTNYAGKIDYGLKSLRDRDFVYIHIEAPDEAGHNGDWQAKKECIEKIDNIVVGHIVNFMKEREDVRVLISPDHPTPVAKRTHTRHPVPFVLFGQGVKGNGLQQYSETCASKGGVVFESGQQLISQFFKEKF